MFFVEDLAVCYMVIPVQVPCQAGCDSSPQVYPNRRSGRICTATLSEIGESEAHAHCQRCKKHTSPGNILTIASSVPSNVLRTKICPP